MSRSLNKVQVIGNLCRDPEIKYMPNGNAVANLSVATDESYNDKNTGQKVEKAEFHRLTAYGKLAEIIGQYLKKGSRAYFEGKLQTREWEKDGIKRYTTEIITNDMMMLDGKQDGQQGGFAQQAPQQGFQQPAQPQYNPNQPSPPPANQQMGVHQAGQSQQQNQFNQQGDFDPDLPF